MNKTITFALMVAVIASVGLATTAVMSPLSAHADNPKWCYDQGTGNNPVCGFPTKKKCEAAAPGAANKCYQE
jgi:Protein of unknown function (DUF3551)